MDESGSFASRIDDSDRIDAAMAKIRSGVEAALSNPMTMSGWRAQGMFMEIVRALGTVQLIKEEDAGDAYFAGLRPKFPDFRVRTAEDELLLVEVKNCHQKRSTESPFVMSEGELNGLQHYADVAGGGDLKIAIFWSQWGLWTLIDPRALTPFKSGKVSIDLPHAAMASEMLTLGDFMLGTPQPLTFTLLTDPASNRTIADDGTCEFRIGGVETRCAGSLVTDETEQSLVLFLLFNSPWPQSDDTLVENGEVISMSFVSVPGDPDAAGPLHLHGAMSSLLSRAYLGASLLDGDVTSLSVTLDVDLASLLPDEGTSHVVPTLRLHVTPNFDWPEGSE